MIFCTYRTNGIRAKKSNLERKVLEKYCATLEIYFEAIRGDTKHYMRFCDSDQDLSTFVSCSALLYGL